MEYIKGKASQHLDKKRYRHNQRFITYLPTEFVAKSPSELIEMCGRFNHAAAYELSDYNYALEVWHNYGDDGHIEMVEMGYIIVKQEHLPKNYEEYRNLVGG